MAVLRSLHNRFQLECYSGVLKESRRELYLDLRIVMKKGINYELQWILLTSFMMATFYTTMMVKQNAFQLDHLTIL